jgi:hypothetical protein
MTMFRRSSAVLTVLLIVASVLMAVTLFFAGAIWRARVTP